MTPDRAALFRLAQLIIHLPCVRISSESFSSVGCSGHRGARTSCYRPEPKFSMVIWEETFRRWYPAFRSKTEAKAA
jgi:hypothetical protein